MSAILNIKNMFCPLCISAVEGILGDLQIEFDSVSLGNVQLKKVLSADDLVALETRLEQRGFELLNDRKLQIVEKIKNSIVQIIHFQDDPQKIGHLSEQLSGRLNLNYPLLSKLFSEQEGITIEKYFILQKIEKAKVFLKYHEMNITEISDRLNYSSSQHFSRQFKSVTGMSPSEFLKQRESHRKPLLNIKNMFCPRCISAVEGILGDLQIEFDSVSLGNVQLKKVLSADDLVALETRLEQRGFELLNDRKLQIVKKIKNLIVQIIDYQDDPQKIGHLSEQLPGKLNLNYPILSKLFSEQEGITIEKYFILQKIEKAKELLKYHEMRITEISDRLNYSSSQHFSRQFKSVTGMSPSEFLKQRESRRKPLDNIKTILNKRGVHY